MLMLHLLQASWISINVWSSTVVAIFFCSFICLLLFGFWFLFLICFTSFIYNIVTFEKMSRHFFKKKHFFFQVVNGRMYVGTNLVFALPHQVDRPGGVEWDPPGGVEWDHTRPPPNYNHKRTNCLMICSLKKCIDILSICRY